MLRKLLVLTVVSLAGVVLFACHDDHDHSSDPSSCRAIVDACHPKDTGSGPIHECHEFAESGKTETDCAARKAECLATCSQPADAGPG